MVGLLHHVSMHQHGGLFTLKRPNLAWASLDPEPLVLMFLCDPHIMMGKWASGGVLVKVCQTLLSTRGRPNGGHLCACSISICAIYVSVGGTADKGIQEGSSIFFHLGLKTF